jgi:hypothetical protein
LRGAIGRSNELIPERDGFSQGGEVLLCEGVVVAHLELVAFVLGRDVAFSGDAYGNFFICRLFLHRVPFQVREAVIGGILVAVIDGWLVLRIWNERGSDDTRHQKGTGLCVLTEAHLLAAVDIDDGVFQEFVKPLDVP